MAIHAHAVGLMHIHAPAQEHAPIFNLAAAAPIVTTTIAAPATVSLPVPAADPTPAPAHTLERAHTALLAAAPALAIATIAARTKIRPHANTPDPALPPAVAVALSTVLVSIRFLTARRGVRFCKVMVKAKKRGKGCRAG